MLLQKSSNRRIERPYNVDPHDWSLLQSHLAGSTFQQLAEQSKSNVSAERIAQIVKRAAKNAAWAYRNPELASETANLKLPKDCPLVVAKRCVAQSMSFPQLLSEVRSRSSIQESAKELHVSTRTLRKWTEKYRLKPPEVKPDTPIEDLLRSVATHFDALSEYVRYPLALWDKSVRIVRVNSAAKVAFGVTAEEIVGKTWMDLFDDPISRRNTAEEAKRAMKLEQGKSLSNQSAFTIGGRKIEMKWVTMPVPGRDDLWIVVLNPVSVPSKAVQMPRYEALLHVRSRNTA